MYWVHPLAFVDDTARLSEGCRVYQFASLTRGAKLGERCTVAPGTHIDGSTFGDDCVIGHNIAMGPGFLVGNRVFVGPGVVFCNDSWPIADKNGFEAERLLSGEMIIIKVGDGTGIGANAVILPGVTIGKNCMIAAGARVSRDVPDNHLYAKDSVISQIPDGFKPRRMKPIK